MAEPQATVGHYRIGARLGASAMGEVWRAMDTRLGREVAIKILLASVADDPLRLARVTREAQLLASRTILASPRFTALKKRRLPLRMRPAGADRARPTAGRPGSMVRPEYKLQ